MGVRTLLWSEDEFFHKISNVPLQKISWTLAEKKQVDVWFRRDDLLDPELSGNKFYKLYYNLVAAYSQGVETLLSFGGAYSNHLHALAAAGHRFGFKTIGVVRGEESSVLSSTLSDAKAWGMTLHFVARDAYRAKDEDEFRLEVLEKIRKVSGDFFLIPEGGSNELGARGTSALGHCLQESLNHDYTAVCLASGTGTTLAGVAAGLQNRVTAIGFSVLKGSGDLGSQVSHQINPLNRNVYNWRLISGYHCGGYAKKLPDYLSKFLNDFECETKVPLDPVYTLKLCWGVAQLLEQNYWAASSKLVLIHSGGLQGRRGFNL